MPDPSRGAEGVAVHLDYTTWTTWTLAPGITTTRASCSSRPRSDLTECCVSLVRGCALRRPSTPGHQGIRGRGSAYLAYFVAFSAFAPDFTQQISGALLSAALTQTRNYFRTVTRVTPRLHIFLVLATSGPSGVSPRRRTSPGAESSTSSVVPPPPSGTLSYTHIAARSSVCSFGPRIITGTASCSAMSRRCPYALTPLTQMLTH